MRHPFLDSRIILFYRAFVSEIGEKHIASHRQCSRPGHIIRVIVPIGRGYVGDTAILTLCFADVTRPFGVHGMIIEQHTFSPASHGAVT